MFNMFKKDKELNEDCLMLRGVLSYCDKCGGSCTASIVSNKQWKSIRFLNKHGLIKYFKNGNDTYNIVPTLFCLYLTKYKKYDIEKTYNEAVKLYNFIGEEKNEYKNGQVLLQRRTNK